MTPLEDFIQAVVALHKHVLRHNFVRCVWSTTVVEKACFGEVGHAFALIIIAFNEKAIHVYNGSKTGNVNRVQLKCMQYHLTTNGMQHSHCRCSWSTLQQRRWLTIQNSSMQKGLD
uniref:Uncharacterized protein n=1 Tax=Lygus hesperus TaxID=30085 RepID=A0A0A9ZGZ0_LYGHE